MAEHRETSIAPLILGLVLVTLGTFFLIQTFTDFEINWWKTGWLLVALFFLGTGVTKIVHHFVWDEERVASETNRSSLLGGLFRAAVGVGLLLSYLGVAGLFAVLGTWWPLIIVLFGLGKVIDFYRFGGRMQFRGGEIVGLIILIVVGPLMAAVGEAHLPLLEPGGPWRDWGIDLGIRGKVYSWSDSTNVVTTGLQSVRIGNLYGDLEVEGVGEGEPISIELTKDITGESRAQAEEVAQRIQIRTATEGSELRISTNRQDLESENRFKTHLVIRIPRTMHLRAINGYGRLEVSNLSSDCELENVRGRIEVASVQGNVSVKNRYALVRIEGIEGNLKVENRRGRVEARDVEGSVEIATERKRIEVAEVRGGVRVKNYHGSVVLSEVDGAAVVDAAGSTVEVSDVRRLVEVTNSYNPVTAVALKQGLILKTEHSSVTLSELTGSVRVEAKRSTINATDLNDGLTVEGLGTGVVANDIRGAVDIATSLRKVRLEDFGGPTKVQNKDGGEIELVSHRAPSGELTVENTNGDITLSLPSNADFSLFAQTRGKIESDFGQESDQGDDRVLQVDVGSGVPRIRLQSEFSTIRIRKI